ncbi:MAG: hypothetical protein HN576_03245 [Bacteriovoracaceae bacterium]|nr:hypothetical protein [Bacteriovoracaceae bacterium]
MELKQHYDMVFAGGRLSGSLAARFLKLQYPDKKILIIEKEKEFKWSPGESTVGVAGIFMIRDLGLSTYCYQNHLPKNGLRYFFEDSRIDFKVESCSEVGTNMIPVIPTYQIDRAKFDTDLLKMNAKIGIDILLEADITNIKVEKNKSHEILIQHLEKKISISCEWFVNTAGRNNNIDDLLEKRNPIISSGDLNTAAAWGRFKNVIDIDNIGSEKWKEKVGFTSRYLSTNHFMKEGSWVWAIPIGDDIVSFGIVYDKKYMAKPIETEKEFLAALNENSFVKKLIIEAELLDFQFGTQLDYCRENFCFTDKIAYLGEAYGFIDPFYSPGTDIIARECHLLAHLVSGDENLPHKVKVINKFMKNEFDFLTLIYKDQYQGFGSFELFNIKSLWDFYAYTNLLVWFFYAKKYSDFGWIEQSLKNYDATMVLSSAIQSGVIELCKYFKKENKLENKNISNFSLRQNRFLIEEKILHGYRDQESFSNHISLVKLVISELIEKRFDLPSLTCNKLIQSHITIPEASIFKLTRKWFNSFLGKISETLTSELNFPASIEVKIEHLRVGKFFSEELTKSQVDDVNYLLFEEQENTVERQLMNS